MHDNQDATKQLLISLIRGEQTSIDMKAQRSLALWSARSAMTAEYLDPDRIAVPQSHRKWLMDRREPPTNWFIWVGGYGGARPDHFQELLVHEIGTLTPPPDTNPAKPFAIQSTTIGLAKLVIYIVGTDMPHQSFQIPPGMLWQIWPPQIETIRWPSNLLLNDNTLAYVARAMLKEFYLNIPAGWKMGS